MRLSNFISTHKMSLLSFILVALAAVLGADCSFAMAVEPVVEADPANPSDNMGVYNASTNDGGRPADEALQPDQKGGNTQLQNKPATATDVRDAGLEAEDYDKEITNFRKFRFPIETYIANRCRPVKVASYEHGHYRSASTVLESEITLTNSIIVSNIPSGTTGHYTSEYTPTTKILLIDRSKFDNPEALTEFSTVIVGGVEGYAKNDAGTWVANGELVLFVEDNKDANSKIKFRVLNPSEDTTAHYSTIATGTIFYIGATACSESQIRVASETYLPEKHVVTLQKKAMTCVITDEFEEQDKKVGFITKDVLANAMYNFKRKCARTHWNGVPGRIDVKVPETGGRESVYFENGILRQIPMLYTHSSDLSDDDMMAITSLQFTENSVSDSATAFCGKREMKRLMKLVNSSTHFKDVSKVEVNEYGIKVRRYRDNFGEIEFIYDPTLDDIGYQDFMVVVDLRNAVRYYKRNEKTITQDMSQSGESREAKAHNKSIIDCVALKGYNAVLVCPSSAALQASNLGGIQANIVSVSTLTGVSDHTKVYYLTADDSTAGFVKGTIVQWNSDINDWTEFEGLVG